MTPSDPDQSGRVTDVDVVIVGAGFAGLRFLHESRGLGLTARVFEAGSEVGGTWYWNRYPGARTDTEAWGYCFAFDEDLLQEWNWSERFPRQPEVLEYLRHVADRHDMRRDITFGTRVQSAHFDDDRNVWTVTTDRGDVVTCTYFVAATGVLSATLDPPFPGLETFEGEWYQTSRWPKEKVEFAGKRVAVVGAGATAVQVLPAVAHTAEHVTMLQRTPNYVMPSRNRILDDAERAEIKSAYGAILAQMDKQFLGFPFEDTWGPSTAVSSERDFRQILDAGWESGGFRYLFETFDDVLADQSVNDRCAEFVREKIRAIVKDEATAEALCPQDYPVCGKRPPLGHFYYEAFNRDNVSLVSVLHNPIARITSRGIRLEDGSEHEFDLIIFALGFDAVTGAMTSMDIRGRDGRSISEEWAPGPETMLGLACAGFPNMFMIFGPGSPAGNLPPVHHHQSEWIGALIRHAREAGYDRIETTFDAQRAYSAMGREIFDSTLLSKGSAAAKAWWTGSNIAGKTETPLMFFGGVAGYLPILEKEATDGYPGFTITTTSRPG